MKIKTVTIRNVKGIKDRVFVLDLIPNKPNVLVAPNGSGKSSFAVAFDSINSKRLVLDKVNWHMKEEGLLPELIVEIENDGGDVDQLKADTTSNTLAAKFDVMVINSRLTPKASKLKFGGVTHAMPSLEVRPIELEKIPDKVDFDYSFSAQKIAFGTNGKILPNIGDLFGRPAFVKAFANCDFTSFAGKRVAAAVKAALATINQQTGTANTICQWITTNLLASLKAIAPLDALASAIGPLEGTEFTGEVDAFLAAIQVSSMFLSDSKRFKGAIKYAQYSGQKARYERLCCDLYEGWADVRVVEDKKHGRLILAFPNAHLFSNGQRDILSCVFMLEKAHQELSKDNCILIIDEVFDYLDDGNLIAFQYFITILIKRFKTENRNLFPILLTHLDPEIFHHFCFGGHKIKVHYLDAKASGKSEGTTRLIEARGTGGKAVQSIEQHYFHYHPTPLSHKGLFKALKMQEDWEDPAEFRRYVDGETTRYQGDKNYDPLAICFAVRINIEETVYSKLTDDAHKKDFISINGTTQKLDYAVSVGVDVPESYYLLGLIYNDGLHAKPGRNLSSIIGIKLRHPVIKHMISRMKA